MGSAWHRERASGVDPRLHAFLDACRALPFDVSVMPDGGVRSADDQERLYAKGRTAPGSIVTNARTLDQAPHARRGANGYGQAVDVAPYRRGADPLQPTLYAADWADEAAFLKLGQLAESMGLVSGRSWDDAGHVETPDWRFMDFYREPMSPLVASVGAGGAAGLLVLLIGGVLWLSA